MRIDELPKAMTQVLQPRCRYFDFPLLVLTDSLCEGLDRHQVVPPRQTVPLMKTPVAKSRSW